MKSLKEESYSAGLFGSCKEDTPKGHMAALRLAHKSGLSAIALSPRFMVRHGANLCMREYVLVPSPFPQ